MRRSLNTHILCVYIRLDGSWKIAVMQGLKKESLCFWYGLDGDWGLGLRLDVSDLLMNV
jgi:hypothetical protein